ncbi:hypothetical protein EVG20_g10168 [Dentipellis fragilis]|uniref:Uncharacterized protein n=1 Tax=Dentipellis fragilis TaxID=205917 RepID=A0A4Y9XTE7_9AGAM|nr:hypothetical protein EVG20_g10168 [Dentipellis fragilis]
MPRGNGHSTYISLLALVDLMTVFELAIRRVAQQPVLYRFLHFDAAPVRRCHKYLSACSIVHDSEPEPLRLYAPHVVHAGREQPSMSQDFPSAESRLRIPCIDQVYSQPSAHSRYLSRLDNASTSSPSQHITLFVIGLRFTSTTHLYSTMAFISFDPELFPPKIAYICARSNGDSHCAVMPSELVYALAEARVKAMKYRPTSCQAHHEMKRVLAEFADPEHFRDIMMNKIKTTLMNRNIPGFNWDAVSHSWWVAISAVITKTYELHELQCGPAEEREKGYILEHQVLLCSNLFQAGYRLKHEATTSPSPYHQGAPF